MQYTLVIDVYRCDKISLAQARGLQPDYVLISPGPKDPGHTGISIPLIKSLCQKVPILGVCLGMQCMNEAFGGSTLQAPVPIHGKTSRIFHDSRHIFENTPSPFVAARYHSLMCQFDSSELQVTARSRDNVIMGLSHPEFPLHGVQFHPESFMTEHGFTLVENFLRLGPLKDPVRTRYCRDGSCNFPEKRQTNDSAKP